ncbi:hypothetical protein TVAG_000640 [Trichomonas vaginalis G3]|uniref:Uncharacterized protein n=1 Tax=Trichomonas vaginalis (strain ATCC PRA-98 / G3) TaxID=412133 RepID=A2EHU0_TRIV3|nr:armadillo (ARM) repeat-containing protein family [Trichomonas vaginalis G3]EAY07780.1 hypothetical protein TVAG_000640 [Trichomonas vaginalis G3]KAI5542945.1 armadillo (ARM) repeat-containing protein family [Trichomonas vaginalis G3]|eukprot:XP_001320003.1 hypothetical protein [Trichomonas vaginalis G3]
MDVSLLISNFGSENNDIRLQVHEIIDKYKEDPEFIQQLIEFLFDDLTTSHLKYITLKTIEFFKIPLNESVVISFLNFISVDFQLLRFEVNQIITKYLTVSNLSDLFTYFQKFPEDVLYCSSKIIANDTRHECPDFILSECIDIVNESTELNLLILAIKIIALNDDASQSLAERAFEIYQNEITYENFPLFIELFPILQYNPESQELYDLLQEKIKQLANLTPFENENFEFIDEKYNISFLGYCLVDWLNNIIVNLPEMAEEDQEPEFNIDIFKLYPYICMLCQLPVQDRNLILNDPEAFLLFADYLSSYDINQEEREKTLRYCCFEYFAYAESDQLCKLSLELMEKFPNLQEPILYMYGQSLYAVVDCNLITIAIPAILNVDDPLAVCNYIPLACYKGLIEDMSELIQYNDFKISFNACRGITKNKKVYSDFCLEAILKTFGFFELFETGIVISLLELINNLLQISNNFNSDIFQLFFELLKNTMSQFIDNDTTDACLRIINNFISESKYYPFLFDAFLPVLDHFTSNTETFDIAIQLISTLFNKLPKNDVEIPFDVAFLRDFIVSYSENELSITVLPYLSKCFSFLCRIGYFQETFEFICKILPTVLDNSAQRFVGSLLLNYISFNPNPNELILLILEAGKQYLISNADSEQTSNSKNSVLRFLSQILGFYSLNCTDFHPNEDMIALAQYVISNVCFTTGRFDYLLSLMFLFKCHPNTSDVYAELQHYLTMIFYDINEGESYHVEAENYFVDDPVVSSHPLFTCSIYGFMKSLNVEGCPEFIPKWLEEHAIFFFRENSGQN